MIFDVISKVCFSIRLDLRIRVASFHSYSLPLTTKFLLVAKHRLIYNHKILRSVIVEFYLRQIACKSSLHGGSASTQHGTIDNRRQSDADVIERRTKKVHFCWHFETRFVIIRGTWSRIYNVLLLSVMTSRIQRRRPTDNAFIPSEKSLSARTHATFVSSHVKIGFVVTLNVFLNVLQQLFACISITFDLSFYSSYFQVVNSYK